MIEFQLLDSDFWGNSPQVKIHQLREDICKGFCDICLLAMDELRDKVQGTIVSRGNGLRYEDIAGKRVYIKMEVSEHFENCQVTFKSRNDSNQQPDKFVAYCVYAVNRSFGSHSSAVYENKGGWFECIVSLKKVAASHVISFITDSD